MEIAICAGQEDGRRLKQMLCFYTNDAGSLEIDTFTRRESLLYRMKGKRFDVVIVALPGAVGMETAVGARQFDENVTLIWASDEAAFIAQSYRLRAAMFLSLPLVEEQVTEALRRVGLGLNDKAALRRSNKEPGLPTA